MGPVCFGNAKSQPLGCNEMMTARLCRRSARWLLCAAVALTLAAPASAQLRRRKKAEPPPAPATQVAPPTLAAPTTPAPQEAPAQKTDRAAAYYNFAMAHMYSELAQQYGNRGEYLNKAIEHYRLAIKADPGSPFLSEELSDLYIQSGQIRSAVQEQEEALKVNPRDVHARRILGRV